MNATTCVNLHCHSTCSDGRLEPEALARLLARGGVVFAALTDHDTVDGLARFEAALRRRGIGAVSGVEITSDWRGEEAHLLAYGFDPGHPELLETLRAVRQRRQAATQSVANALRSTGGAAAAPVHPAAPGPLPIADAVALVHRAGGRAFLAHPLVLRSNPAALREILCDLRAFGLDGVEALYAPDPPAARDELIRLAAELGLLVCAGTDIHDPTGQPGMSMPHGLWQAFRDALHLRAATTSAHADEAYTHARRPRRHFGLHVILPSLLAIVCFVVTFWGFLIPAFERALLDRKREMIGELTHSAWSILDDAERQVTAGRLTREAAQAEARDRIAALRYGHENKDYFWLQDMHPRMIMHPYRPDLNGQDLTDFRDPRGARIFVEFADVVRRHHEGYVDYVWQWPDDPRRLEPKESYVKGFDPWGWVIGTGLYIEDVRHEIARLERGLMHAALVITAIVSLLLLHVVRHSRRLDRERLEAADELHATTERYRSLVEAATEGNLMVLDGRCRYANPHLLALLGYSAAELELLDLTEVLPPGDANAAVWSRIEALQGNGAAEPGSVAGELRRRDGGGAPCMLALTRIAFGGRDAIVLLARETGGLFDHAARRMEATPWDDVAAHVPIGLFQARNDTKASLLAANAIAARCLRAAAGAAGDEALSLAAAFRDPAAFSLFMERLKRDGTAACRLSAAPMESGVTASFALRAVLVRKAADSQETLDGLIEDISSLVRREQEHDDLVERLQSSMLFLHEPVGRLLPPGVFCPGDMPVQKAAALLVERQASAALVCDTSGAALGIVTAHDLCARVLAEGLDARVQVRTVMSAPIRTLPAHAPVYEALQRMQEQHLRHLAVTDDTGRILGALNERDILPFQQYGAAVLTSEISRAAMAEDVVRGCRRTAPTVQAMLDSDAHPRKVMHLLTSVCDAATERFVQLAIEELGPPPTRFAFLALGSQGRREQTLLTDQDNAIIYAPPEHPSRAAETAAYFLELGRRVCGGLNAAGYPYCRGHFMAQNPVWTRALPAWKTHFSYWAARAEPEELLIFTVFFDFRAVCGDAGLVSELRQHVFAELRDAPAFFPHFARHALLFRPPVMLLGRILMGGARGTTAGMLDIKAVMLPIVAFARLYALHNGIARTHTLERLDALVDAGKLTPASRDEIAATYAFLMRLRLRRQALDIHAGRTPDNLIDPRRLGHADRAMLRQAFAHIRVLQRRIGYDFLGGTPG